MAKIKRTQDELEKLLEEQINFIKSSAKAYDEGFHGEAKRLAAHVSTLVCDRGRSSSLLQQLGLKHIGFLDTSSQNMPGNKAPYTGLVIIKVSKEGPKYIPRSVLPPRPDYVDRFIRFDKWWNQLVIIDQSGFELSREDIILTLRDKEGGGHVDPSLDENYVNLTKAGKDMWSSIKNDSPVKPVELATIRQIAHEVLITIKKSVLII